MRRINLDILLPLVLMHSDITNYVFYTTAQLMTFGMCVQEIFLLDSGSF